MYNFANFEDDTDLDELDEDALMEVVKANEEMDRKKVIYMPNGKIVRA